jgi:hypothetical protein
VRKFIVALEKDLSPDAPKGQRIIWMKQQADRLDPMLRSPLSILDRKRERIVRKRRIIARAPRYRLVNWVYYLGRDENSSRYVLTPRVV